MMELIQNYISTLQLTMDQLPRQLIADVIDVLQQARRQGQPGVHSGERRLGFDRLPFCL